MIPVKQDKFGNHHGNCFAACVASLLELPLGSVPNFCVLSNYESLGESEWFDAFLWWLGELGWSYVELYASYKEMANGQLCILTGKSPRGDFKHCVVGRFEDGVIYEVFDPHPSDDGLDGKVEQYGLFIPIDPARNL
jgi:hypothetical protein